jgi:hypothetical protein
MAHFPSRKLASRMVHAGNTSDKTTRIYLIVVDHADEGFIILRKALKDLGVQQAVGAGGKFYQHLAQRSSADSVRERVNAGRYVS